MTDKEKLIGFLESSGYKYEFERPAKDKISYTVKTFVNKEFDEEIKIDKGCGYNMYGIFYFLKGKSVDYAMFE